MQSGQPQIALYLAEGRPEWADVAPEKLADYASCAIMAIEQDERTPFADFDETDALIALASEACAEQRANFDTAMGSYLVENGYFSTSEEARDQFTLLRAMAFIGAITNRFDNDTGSLSPASTYFVSRLPLLYTTTQGEDEYAADSGAASTPICSEMCIMADSQEFLSDITSRPRPEWARIMITQMPPYASCGVRVISASGATLYEDFDETDRLFDRAFVECAEERTAFDKAVRAKVLDDGVFENAAQADAQIAPLRAMLFGARMADIFDTQSGLDSPGDRYAASRFPEFYNSFQKRRLGVPATKPPPPITLTPAPSASPETKD
ncbi:MAG: hypothetical protein AAFX04_13450 [Pseudomonadota bacterium]